MTKYILYIHWEKQIPSSILIHKIQKKNEIFCLGPEHLCMDLPPASPQQYKSKVFEIVSISNSTYISFSWFLWQSKDSRDLPSCPSICSPSHSSTHFLIRKSMGANLILIWNNNHSTFGVTRQTVNHWSLSSDPAIELNYQTCDPSPILHIIGIKTLVSTPAQGLEPPLLSEVVYVIFEA